MKPTTEYVFTLRSNNIKVALRQKQFDGGDSAKFPLTDQISGDVFNKMNF